jgi:outer membrane protein assembly factor BamD (BamD/ComL family)
MQWFRTHSLLFCILLLSSSLSAPVDLGRVHLLTSAGIQRLYNREIDQALQTFYSVSRLAPADPCAPQASLRWAYAKRCAALTIALT